MTARNRGWIGRWLAAIAAVTFVAGLTAAEESAQSPENRENPYVWRSEIKSVAVFKNGLGFYLREGTVKLRDGWCLAKEIPPAAFGTLAIFAGDKEQTVDIVGSGPGEVVEFDGRDAADDIETKRQRLEAALHLKVQLQYRHQGQNRSAAGELVSLGPEYAVLEDAANSFAVPIAAIARMQVLELPLRIHVAGMGEQRPEQAQLAMAYLRKGVTWIPDYTLQVVDDVTAELTLRGTLVNEAEDLVHTDVHLVVGVPHFVHTDYMAPIAIGQVLRTIGTAVSQNVPEPVMTQQVMSRAAIVSNAAVAPQFQGAGVVERPVDAGGGDLAAAVGRLPELSGPAGADYTVYSIPDLTLRRGEKAILTLLKRKIRYSHLYRWSPPGRMEHFLVLHNSTETAWTTGPCLAMEKDRPLSEDLLLYTPKGGSVEFAVTAAINVAHEKSEQEVDRKLREHSPSSNVYYDLVTLEGKLQLKNFEPRPAEIVVTNTVPGKPTMAEGGEVSLDPSRLKLLEREATIRWRLELPPGGQKTLTYRYERYVPSH